MTMTDGEQAWVARKALEALRAEEAILLGQRPTKHERLGGIRYAIALLAPDDEPTPKGTE